MTSAATAGAKTLAWWAVEGFVAVARTIVRLAGAERRVDAVVYKIDRLGDWFCAEASITRLVRHERARGRTVVIWASLESSAVRQLRAPDCRVEEVRFEPRGLVARLRRTLAILRLSAIYRTDTLYCLRHGPDPVRDFVLRTLPAARVHALSWVIRADGGDGIPHEIRRHAWILAGAGLPPIPIRELLPRLDRNWSPTGGRIVLTPFSSAAVKDWPDSAWSAVVAALSARSLRWEIWVGPDQRSRAESLRVTMQRAAAHARVSVHSGSLRDLVAAIASAELVLSVDTLAAHLACAIDAPLVALLGGGQFGDFAPWAQSARQRWLSHPLPCFGCNWECSRPQNDCINLITPARVVAEASRFLAEGDVVPRSAGAPATILSSPA